MMTATRRLLSMLLTRGARLGPYEIESILGAGGMGEVYRARDTRLDRIVAIKVLSPLLAADETSRKRFEREARAVAALNHPHICALYDVGEAPNPGPAERGAQPAQIRFLVMEFLEGETLAAQLARGPLPIALALKHGSEIADALDKAHRQGVVHRDLKPGNIVLTRAGAKLLDFGLARLSPHGPSSAASTRSDLPTMTVDLTAEGTILGTLQYMAPEQLEDREADTRTDIFALGAMLYEMVTGRKAFEGRSHAGLMSAILERQPEPISSHQPASPPGLDAIVSRCLAKDPDDRWQSAGDLGAALQWLVAPSSRSDGVSSATVGDAKFSVRRDRLWKGVAGVLAMTTIVLLVLIVYRRESPIHPAAVRLSILPPDKSIFQTPLLSGSAAPVGGSISPDGRTLAFTARDSSGKILLWVRSLDSVTAQSLPGTDDAALPFWSPDSRSLGFFAQGRLKRVDAMGGSPQELCNVTRGRGGSWNREGVIIFAAGLSTGLSRVSATGGAPQALTKLIDGQLSHRFPYFLPDGQRYLYYREGARADDTGIFIGALDQSNHQRLLTADSAAIYSRSGHLLFVRQSTLFAQEFNAATLQTDGDPVPLADLIPSEGSSPAFSVSDGGVLTHASGLAEDQFAWFDRTGKLIETVGPPGHYRGVDLSPDGKNIAVHRHDGNGGDIWVFSANDAPTRVTFNAAEDNSSPAWSPDGTHIAFGARRNGKWGLYRKRADRSPAAEMLDEREFPQIPSDWSPDGASLVYWVFGGASIDQWLLPIGENRNAEQGARGGSPKQAPSPLLDTRFGETHAQLSPNGKWVAYVSSQEGGLQVYVRAFPSGGDVWRVSTTGGVMPRWRQDNKELFYVTAYDNGKLMSATVQGERTKFVSGTPKELFNTGMVTPPHSTSINVYHAYDVSTDGLKFLLPRPVSRFGDASGPASIAVVLNWEALLQR
jgi:serine/threonine protein kinase